LKTEYGIAIGFDAEAGSKLVRQPPITSSRNAELTAAPTRGRLRLADVAVAALSTEVAPTPPAADAPAIRGTVASAFAGRDNDDFAAARPARFEGAPETALEQLQNLAAERDGAVVEARALAEERDAARAEAAAAVAEAERRAAELEPAQEQAAALRSRVRKLEGEVEAGAARLHAVERELALVREQEQRHLAENARLRASAVDSEKRLAVLRQRVDAAVADARAPQHSTSHLEETTERLSVLLGDTNCERRADQVATTFNGEIWSDRERSAPQLDATERHLTCVSGGGDAGDA
jgi:hypothetical protein